MKLSYNIRLIEAHSNNAHSNSNRTQHTPTSPRNVFHEQRNSSTYSKKAILTLQPLPYVTPQTPIIISPTSQNYTNSTPNVINMTPPVFNQDKDKDKDKDKVLINCHFASLYQQWKCSLESSMKLIQQQFTFWKGWKTYIENNNQDLFCYLSNNSLFQLKERFLMYKMILEVLFLQIAVTNLAASPLQNSLPATQKANAEKHNLPSLDSVCISIEQFIPETANVQLRTLLQILKNLQKLLFGKDQISIGQYFMIDTQIKQFIGVKSGCWQHLTESRITENTLIPFKLGVRKQIQIEHNLLNPMFEDVIFYLRILEQYLFSSIYDPLERERSSQILKNLNANHAVYQTPTLGIHAKQIKPAIQKPIQVIPGSYMQQNVAVTPVNTFLHKYY
jgi:hypothetical protein